MLHRIKKLISLITMLLLLFMINIDSYAVITDHYTVSSRLANYDYKHHLAIYSGDVEMTHTSEKLSGDKVMIYYDVQHHRILKLLAFGNPAHYQQITPKTHVTAQGQQITYDPTAKTVMFFNDASINKNGDIISGPKIWYDIAHETMQTLPSDKQHQTIIVLQPEQPTNQPNLKHV